MPAPRRVLLTTPRHFKVVYVINPHMQGHIGSVDLDAAEAQWTSLRDTYAALGIDVSVVEGAEDLPDMVFCANQSLPYRTQDGTLGIVLSRMHAPQRKPEVEHYARFFSEQGYEVLRLDAELEGDFEGMGDAIWHPDRMLLWGGCGFRTDRNVYDRLSEKLGFAVCVLNLTDPAFYHLDTCFSVLDERTVLIYPGAFDADGLALIHHVFDRVLEVPEDEARELFACNSHCPDRTNVIIQRGCVQTNALLREAGFRPIEVDTDEFLKSGGSVFCMKQMYW